jgi:hypothetical protein
MLKTTVTNLMTPKYFSVRNTDARNFEPPFAQRHISNYEHTTKFSQNLQVEYYKISVQFIFPGSVFH